MHSKMTPLMQQYWEIKAHHEDSVVLFRMGDFFEMFHHDAEVAAPIIGIALTQRNKKDSESAKMCGVPHHSIAGPIAKLLAAGHKVAICDQIEDPALAKGLVKRAVTRVLTPGMVYDPDTLDQLSANYLCAYDSAKIAFADITTGEAFAFVFANDLEREELLLLLLPVEIILEQAQLTERRQLSLGKAPLLSLFQEGSDAIDRIRTYVGKLQGADVVKSLGEFTMRVRGQHLRLTPTVLRHLEVFVNGRGDKEGTLFAAINRTQTAAGARLLKNWLSAPLLDEAEILQRQGEIQQWIERPVVLKSFRQSLAQLGDVERRLGKIHSTTFNARDLAAIAQSMSVGYSLHAVHPSQTARSGATEARDFARHIETTLNDELPATIKEGGMIRRGAVAALDELITLTQDTQKLLLELEAREREATGIASLKVRYNNVFGFYIELTNTHSHKAPAHYRRKQTLTNAERYTTIELDSLEEKILSARSRREQMELEIFTDLKRQVVDKAAEWLQLSRLWSRWDVLSALAWLALERKYCRPSFAKEGLHLELSRHPVVEQGMVKAFVPNSVTINGGECLLLTGPNMAGKSTLMRQVALHSIMAQIGSFVPAQAAQLPLFQQIFTRIGASDSLSEGLSTFMVEMNEASAILKGVTGNSLVIIDEIGRGTSTYDGLSLAQAILEYLVAHKKPYLLFATHYHELTGLSQIHPQIHNGHMAVQEKSGQIQFLHTLQSGPANRSYGIHVAKLAGIPASVTQRAQQILAGFEGQGGKQPSLFDVPVNAEAPAAAPWLQEFASLNLSHMTPLEALHKLHEWQREASS